MAARPDRAGAGQTGPHPLRPGPGRRRGATAGGRRDGDRGAHPGAGPDGDPGAGDGRPDGGTAPVADPAARRRDRDDRRRGAALDRLAGRAGVPRARRRHRPGAGAGLVAPARRAAVAGNDGAAGPRLDVCSSRSWALLVLSVANWPPCCPNYAGQAERLLNGRLPAASTTPASSPGSCPTCGQEDRHGQLVGPGQRVAVEPHVVAATTLLAAARGAGLHGNRVQRVRPPSRAGRRRAPAPSGRVHPLRSGHPHVPRRQDGVRG